MRGNFLVEAVIPFNLCGSANYCNLCCKFRLRQGPSEQIKVVEAKTKMKKQRGKVGRPTDYKPALVEELCLAIATSAL